MINYAIIENLVTTLKGITKGTVVKDFETNNYTYKHTPAEVDDNFKIWTNVREFPAFFVSERNETFEGQHQRRYRGSGEVVITVYVKDEDGMPRKLSECVLDAVMAIHQDIKRGGTANASFLARIEKETRAVKPYGIAEIYLTVLEHFGV